MKFFQDFKRKRKLSQQRRAKRRAQLEVNWDSMFNSLDEETRQETALRYLRDIDNQSLKRLYEAVDLYRKADKILKEKVKDPEPEQPQIDSPVIEPELTPITKEDKDGN